MEKDSLKYKIFLTLSVAAIAIVFFLIVPKFADNSNAEYTYTLLEDGTVTIDGYTGTPSKLELPEEIDGHVVSAISGNAFTNKSGIKTVILPANIKSVGEYAFYNCKDLTSVEGKGVVEIGRAAFYGCSSLKKVEWSPELAIIGDSAFASCTKLSAMTIPASCREIGVDAFMACESLVLDVSQNEEAAAVAAQYGIPTDFTDSDEWLIMLIGLIVLVVIVVLAVGMLIGRRRRKEKINN